MIRRIRSILRIIMGGFAGTFIGQTLYVLWHYHKYPVLYAAQSAPWNASILVSLLVTGVVLTAAMVLYVFLGRCSKQDEQDKGDSHGET